MVTKAIRLPLNHKMERYLSADDYNDALDPALNFLDVMYTFFLRYPWVLDQLEGLVGTKGVSIEYLVLHPVASIVLTCIFGSAAVCMVRSAYQKQAKAQREKAGNPKDKFRRFREAYRKLPRTSLPQKMASHEDKQVPTAELGDSDYDSEPEDSTSAKTNFDPDPSASRSEEHTGLLSENKASLDKLELRKARRALCEGSLNNYIEDLLRDDPELKKKYKRIAIYQNQVQFDLAEAEEVVIANETQLAKAWRKTKRGSALLSEKMSAVVYSTWVGTCVAAFIYWLLWIGTIAITGNVAAFGVEGLGMAAYVIPAGFGLLYPLIKIRNWFRHKFGFKKENEDTENELWVSTDRSLALQASADVSKLLKKAVLMDETQRLRAELSAAGVSYTDLVPATQKRLENDNRLPSLSGGAKKKSVIAFLSTAVSAYINAQYGAWFIMDFLKEVTGLALDTVGVVTGFGVAFIALSAVYAIYKAVLKYREVNKYKAELAAQEIREVQAVDTLEKAYARKLKVIEGLTRYISEAAKNSPDELAWLAVQSKRMNNATVVNNAQVVKNRAYAIASNLAMGLLVFFAGATSGIMIARIVTIAATLTYVPFAALALANPWTIGILVACGLAYGLVKLYEYHKRKKEAEAKRHYEQRQENLELLTSQCELADLQIRLLHDKRQQLSKVNLSKQVSDESLELKLRRPSLTGDTPRLSQTFCAFTSNNRIHELSAELVTTEVASESIVPSSVTCKQSFQNRFSWR